MFDLQSAVQSAECSADYCANSDQTSLNVDSQIGSKLPKIESTCLTTIIGLEIYLEHKQLQ